MSSLAPQTAYPPADAALPADRAANAEARALLRPALLPRLRQLTARGQEGQEEQGKQRGVWRLAGDVGRLERRERGCKGLKCERYAPADRFVLGEEAARRQDAATDVAAHSQQLGVSTLGWSSS